MKPLVGLLTLLLPTLAAAQLVQRMPTPESFEYRILGGGKISCSGNRCDLELKAVSKGQGCAVQYDTGEIEVLKGHSPMIVWTVVSTDGRDYEFMANGIEIHPQDLPALDDKKDLANPGHLQGNKKKYKWHSVNKRESPPGKWRYVINVQRNDKGSAQRCAPVDPIIVNRGY
jgi:hypothetical protein